MMTMSDYKYNMNNFFCPAPWRSMFYHINKASVCCISSKQFTMTPTEFQQSDYLKDLKQKFINGEYDDTCIGCKRLEDSGLQSIRQHMLSLYGESTTDELDYMELRTSNLCNFQCKMCNAQNSSLIAGKVFNITDETFNEIISLSGKLKHLSLTGGEPMLIKHYYELLDHLDSIGKHDLNLRIYTNASVYNPVFVQKLLKFNTELHLSIDAIGATAESIRTGTNWEVVSNNVNKFLALPVDIFFHTTLTAQSLANIHLLVEYLVDISQAHPKCKFTAHTVRTPMNMSVFYMSNENMPHALDSIEQSLPMLDSPKFDQLRTQLLSCKRTLIAKIQTPKPTLNDTH